MTPEQESPTKVVDKRGTAAPMMSDFPADTPHNRKVVVAEQHPVDALIQKMFKFMLEQPEYYEVLKLDRHTRKQLNVAIAKMLTRFPELRKSVV